MRFFPIHVLIKDLSFWVTFFLMVKFINHKDYFFETGWWTGKEIIGWSIYMTMGFSIIGIFILTVVYLILKFKKLRIRSFWFGLGLHLITLLLICTNIELEGRHVSFIIAAMASLVVSGIVYEKLNSEIGIEKQIRKCFGVQ
jgi:hypothetical protein